MFHGDAGSQRGPSGAGSLKFAESLLSVFIFSDRHAAALARRSLCAPIAEPARATGFGVEVHGGAGLEGLYLSRGTGDGVGFQIDAKVSLGEQSRTMRAQGPRLGESAPACCKGCRDDWTVDVRAIDMGLTDGESLAEDVVSNRLSPLLLRTVGRRDRTSDDGGHVEIASDVLLVAIETLRATLATVAHLGVFDRDASIRGYPLTNDHLARVVALQVLVLDGRQSLDVRPQWLFFVVVEVTLDP